MGEAQRGSPLPHTGGFNRQRHRTWQAMSLQDAPSLEYDLEKQGVAQQQPRLR